MRFDNFLKLIELLQCTHCGLTIEQLAEEMELPRRNIERLLEHIREIYPQSLCEVENIYDNKKHWRLENDNAKKLMYFSEKEIAELQSFVKNANNKDLEHIASKLELLNKA